MTLHLTRILTLVSPSFFFLQGFFWPRSFHQCSFSLRSLFLVSFFSGPLLISNQRIIGCPNNPTRHPGLLPYFDGPTRSPPCRTSTAGRPTDMPSYLLVLSYLPLKNRADLFPHPPRKTGQCTTPLLSIGKMVVFLGPPPSSYLGLFYAPFPSFSFIFQGWPSTEVDAWGWHMSPKRAIAQKAGGGGPSPPSAPFRHAWSARFFFRKREWGGAGSASSLHNWRALLQPACRVPFPSPQWASDTEASSAQKLAAPKNLNEFRTIFAGMFPFRFPLFIFLFVNMSQAGVVSLRGGERQTTGLFKQWKEKREKAFAFNMRHTWQVCSSQEQNNRNTGFGGQFDGKTFSRDFGWGDFPLATGYLACLLRFHFSASVCSAASVCSVLQISRYVPQLLCALCAIIALFSEAIQNTMRLIHLE